jgi:hypothetical protein
VTYNIEECSTPLVPSRPPRAWRSGSGWPGRLLAAGSSRHASKRPDGIAPDLPELYRQVCHHLALVRHRRYGADLELRLNRLVRSEKHLVGAAALLFAVPLVLLTFLVPPVDSDVLMFGYYIHNNVSIAFRTFAGGILGGVGSIFFLIYNGLIVGAVLTNNALPLQPKRIDDYYVWMKKAGPDFLRSLPQAPWNLGR